MIYKLGEKYKSYPLWSVEETDHYDIFEVILDGDELAFLNHTDDCIYYLNFLGSGELIKIEEVERVN